MCKEAAKYQETEEIKPHIRTILLIAKKRGKEYSS